MGDFMSKKPCQQFIDKHGNTFKVDYDALTVEFVPAHGKTILYDFSREPNLFDKRVKELSKKFKCENRE